MNLENIRLTTQSKLPKPDSVYKTDGVVFEVYKAKDLYSHKWRYITLHNIVAVCRTSYKRYGARKLFDKYDEKAVVYLARAQYRENSQIINEWLSVRMVPGDGKFNGVGELELYNFKKIPVVELLRRKIKCSKSEFWRYIISDSRMCGIHPYKILKNNKAVPITPEKHRYTPECMALMQLQFIIDFPLKNISFKYVSAMVRPEIINKVITLHRNNKFIKPNFVSAKKTLELPRGASVSVDRKIYSYAFPSYWLNMNELKLLLNTLKRKNKLTPETFQHYLGNNSVEDGVDGEIKIINMLTKKGKLFKSSLTGSKLRLLVDKHVSDVPELQITPINKWRRGFIGMLNHMGINIFTSHPELKSL